MPSHYWIIARFEVAFPALTTSDSTDEKTENDLQEWKNCMEFCATMLNNSLNTVTLTRFYFAFILNELKEN